MSGCQDEDDLVLCITDVVEYTARLSVDVLPEYLLRLDSVFVHQPGGR